MGNVAIESGSDLEAVAKVMENIVKVSEEFRKMTKKSGECQKARVRSYQHLDQYVDGDKVWF